MKDSSVTVVCMVPITSLIVQTVNVVWRVQNLPAVTHKDNVTVRNQTDSVSVR